MGTSRHSRFFLLDPRQLVGYEGWAWTRRMFSVLFTRRSNINVADDLAVHQPTPILVSFWRENRSKANVSRLRL